MRTFYTSGTLGDAYVILCKLYRIAQRERILCKHYTSGGDLRPAIKEIYSLVPNISVEFRDSPLPLMGIVGQFFHHDPKEERLRRTIEEGEYRLEPEYSPEFDLESIEHFSLPKKYETMQLVSGVNPDKMRRLDNDMLKEISGSSELPLVIVGKDSMGYKQKRSMTIDLRGKTSIKETINIIKSSAHFYGCLGFLSLVALSQRVLSTLYLPRGYRDKRAFRSRIRPVAQWMRYVER